MHTPLLQQSEAEMPTQNKVETALVAYAYDQTYLGIMTSLFCATLVFLGAFASTPHLILFSWYAFFLSMILVLTLLKTAYRRDPKRDARFKIWQYCFILSGFLSGLSWGIATLFLFSPTTNIAQTLSLMVVGGVTSSSVAIFSAIVWAAILFLLSSILPLLCKVIFLDGLIFSWLDIGLATYLLYLLLLCIKMNKMMKNSVLLRHENDQLVKNLSSANKQLAHIATHDPLTQLDNRRLFYLNVANAIKRAKRNQELLAILYIDLDGFKEVNDAYGHHIGDELLILIADKMKQILRETDLISRLGGDEFTVILERIHSREDVAKIAKKLCDLLTFPSKISEYEIQISASIGISLYPMDGLDTETLVKAADEAMYAAKSGGRDTFQFFAHTRS